MVVGSFGGTKNRWEHLRFEPAATTRGDDGFYLGRGAKNLGTPLRRPVRAQSIALVQPALLRTLRLRSESELRVRALHALARLRGLAPHLELGSLQDRLPENLRSRNRWIAEAAVMAMGLRADSGCEALLRSLLEDSAEGRRLVEKNGVPARVRALAALGLGLLANRSAGVDVHGRVRAALLRALEDEHDETVAAVVFALGLVPATPSPLAVASGAVDEVRVLLNMFEARPRSHPARVQIPLALVRLLGDSRGARAGEVALALIRALDDRAGEPPAVRTAAVLALGKLGASGDASFERDIRSLLESIVTGKQGARELRWLATLALAEAAGRPGQGERPLAGLNPTRELLLRRLASHGGSTRAWTALALGLLEERAVEAGVRASSDSAQALRLLLGKARSAESAGAIALGLGLMRDAESEPLLIELLRDRGQRDSRPYFAIALGMIGSPRSIAPLLDVIRDPRTHALLMERAALALAMLGDQQSTPLLLSLLESSSTMVQASAASALGWLRDPHALEPLCALLENDRMSLAARAWSAVALGRICDADPRPGLARFVGGTPFDELPATLLDRRYRTGAFDLP